MSSFEIQKNLIEGQEKEYNNRNLDAFCKFFHQDIECIWLNNGKVESGMKLFREGFKKLFDSSPGLHCEIRSRIYCQNSVIDEEFVTGSMAYPDGIHAVAIYHFKDDLISKIFFTF
jgi:hypothetical protein